METLLLERMRDGLLQKQDNLTEWIHTTPLDKIGLIEEAEFAEKTIELHEEDLLVLYTDGVTEAVNLQNQEFGRERLIKLSEQLNNASAKQVVQEIRQGLEEFSEGKPLADDTTIVICKIK